MCSSNVGSPEHKYEVEDSATALMLHKNNVYGSFQFNCYTGIKQESIEINGTKGTLIVTKNDVYLYSETGQELIHESFVNDGILAVSQALKQFNAFELNQCHENLAQHKSVMEAISKLYKNNIWQN